MSDCAGGCPSVARAEAADPPSPYRRKGPDRFRCPANERLPFLCETGPGKSFETWEEAFARFPPCCSKDVPVFVHVLERALGLPELTPFPLACLDGQGRVAPPLPPLSPRRT